jgi:DNA-binding transcriptional regulator YiaG
MVAAATGAKPGTVRGWLSGRSEPSGASAERLIELAEMIKRLALVLRPRVGR